MKKKKEPIISKKKIKRMKRSDGLKMKLVDKYTMERVVACSASRYAKRTALRTYGEEGSELTYSELKRKSDAISLYFLEQGFVKGDRIALIGESCPNWMLAYFGLTGVGLAAVPVLPEFSPKEILHILRDSGVKAVVVNARHIEKILPFVREKPEFLIRLEDLFHIPMPISGELKDRDQFLNAPGRDIARRKMDGKTQKLLSGNRPEEEDLASLIFHKAEFMRQELSKIAGVEVKRSSPTFNEFTVYLPRPATDIITKMAKKGFIAGFPLVRYYPGMDRYLLIAVTEKRTKEDILAFKNALEEAICS